MKIAWYGHSSFPLRPAPSTLGKGNPTAAAFPGMADCSDDRLVAEMKTPKVAPKVG